jgi:hypothetical protein
MAMTKQEVPAAEPPVDRDTLKEAIVTVLKAGLGLEMRTPLAVYPTDGSYMVSFLFFEGEPIPDALTLAQRNRVKREQEMDEYYDSPEEAAELFLKLKELR